MIDYSIWPLFIFIALILTKAALFSLALSVSVAVLLLQENKAAIKAVIDYIRNHKIGFALLIIGGLLGLLEAYPDNSPLYPVINWLSGLSAESIGIAVTVLVIDFWNEGRQRERLKARLIRDLSSGSPDFALRAISELREHGWLDEGLSGADLSGADLSQVNLHQVNLSNANLIDADLSGADLWGTNLSNAELIRANLGKADLSQVNLHQANLSNANLSGANLSHANLHQADLSGADLSDADLSGADLSGAYLWGTNLSNAGLFTTFLMEADLNNANLSGAYLHHADLSNANLIDADLNGADLSWANLSEARYNTEPVNFPLSLFDDAANKSTKWPADFDPKAAGAINLDEASETNEESEEEP